MGSTSHIRNLPDTIRAALAGKITAMTSPSLALNRFGLGARPDDAPPADSQRWLLAQLDAYEPLLPAAWKALPRTPALVDVWDNMHRAERQAPQGQRTGVREGYLEFGVGLHHELGHDLGATCAQGWHSNHVPAPRLLRMRRVRRGRPALGP